MKLPDLQDMWSKRPGREKLLLSVCVLAALFGLVDVLLTAPMEKRLRQGNTQLQALKARADEKKISIGPGGDAPSAASEEEARLRARLKQAQGRLQELNQRVADATRLPETLQAITASVGMARLLELDLTGEGGGSGAAGSPAPAGGPAAAPAAPAASAAPGAVVTATTVGTRRLYRLPIMIKVSGSYAELQTLLTQFELHAQSLEWTSMALDSTEWPAIQLTLKAYVLSHEPRWGASR